MICPKPMLNACTYRDTCGLSIIDVLNHQIVHGLCIQLFELIPREDTIFRKICLFDCNTNSWCICYSS